jgi:hypothetical protein
MPAEDFSPAAQFVQCPQHAAFGGVVAAHQLRVAWNDVTGTELFAERLHLPEEIFGVYAAPRAWRARWFIWIASGHKKLIPNFAYS